VTIRLDCRYCTSRADLVVETAPGAAVRQSRATAVCAAHEGRARRWCAAVGPCRIRLLPPPWQQLTIDDADASTADVAEAGRS
jgi:hypothetical protein